MKKETFSLPYILCTEISFLSLLDCYINMIKNQSAISYNEVYLVIVSVLDKYRVFTDLATLGATDMSSLSKLCNLLYHQVMNQPTDSSFLAVR